MNPAISILQMLLFVKYSVSQQMNECIHIGNPVSSFSDDTGLNCSFLNRRLHIFFLLCKIKRITAGNNDEKGCPDIIHRRWSCSGEFWCDINQAVRHDASERNFSISVSLDQIQLHPKDSVRCLIRFQHRLRARAILTLFERHFAHVRFCSGIYKGWEWHIKAFYFRSIMNVSQILLYLQVKTPSRNFLKGVFRC